MAQKPPVPPFSRDDAIAKVRGAHISGTASPSKHDAIRGFGVDEPLDYTRPGWDNGLDKFDVIMDAVGGESFRRSYELLRPGGRVSAFGASSCSFRHSARITPSSDGSTPRRGRARRR